MNTKWYVLDNSIELGPFSIDDLLEKAKVTPETLVRKEIKSLKVNHSKEFRPLKDHYLLYKRYLRYKRQRSKALSLDENSFKDSPSHDAELALDRPPFDRDTLFYILMIFVILILVFFIKPWRI